MPAFTAGIDGIIEVVDVGTSSTSVTCQPEFVVRTQVDPVQFSRGDQRLFLTHESCAVVRRQYGTEVYIFKDT